MSDDICGHPTTDNGECSFTAKYSDGKCGHHTNEKAQYDGGRPSKLDSHKDEIIESAKEGMTIENCANAAGVDESTLYRWLDRHDEFCKEFKRARREGAQRLIQMGLNDDNDYDSQFARFLLQASHGYTKTERKEITGENGGGIVIDLGDE